MTKDSHGKGLSVTVPVPLLLYLHCLMIFKTAILSQTERLEQGETCFLAIPRPRGRVRTFPSLHRSPFPGCSHSPVCVYTLISYEDTIHIRAIYRLEGACHHGSLSLRPWMLGFSVQS